MRKSITKFFAAAIVCMTLSLGVMAGDISCGFGDTPPVAPPKCGDISCGRQIDVKDTIFAGIFSSLTGILLGD